MINSLMFADYFVLGVLVLSVLIGIWRGFLREVLSLLAWIAAFAVAFIFVDYAVTLLADYVSVPSVRLILAFGGLFLVTLFVGGVVNIVVGQVVLRSGLTGTDRMVGVVFGFLRGVAAIVVLVLIAGLTPLPSDPWWETSQFLPYFQRFAVELRDYLPADYAQYFHFPPPAREALAIPLPT
jgi:membrane protein required for colicin V production